MPYTETPIRVVILNNYGRYETIDANELVTNGLTLWEIDGGEAQLKVADEIDMQSKKILNVTDPVSNQDAATKIYVDDAVQVQIGYGEQSPDAGEVSGAFIKLEDATLTGLLPTAAKTPTELRTSEIFLAVYLNGLRLQDAEWSYGYSAGDKRIEFDGTGSSAIELDTSDDIIVEVIKTS